MSAALYQAVLTRATASYIGLAIGDALGATVEFMTPKEIESIHQVHKNITGGGWLKLKPGSVTDDTEMSLALGNALLSAGDVDANIIAESFSDWMRSKPVDIGNTVRRGILNYRQYGEVVVDKNEFNAGNGACMRCLPIALFTLGNDWDVVISASRTQAHITHHCDVSDIATEHIIDLIQMALMDCSKKELEHNTQEFIKRQPLFRFDKKEIQNPSGYIVETIQAVLQAFYSTDQFESCLVDVVNKGGDADTTGAIAGMLAGAYYGMESIPKRWLRKLDATVLSACTNQAEALLSFASIEAPVTAVKPHPPEPSQAYNLKYY